MRFGCSGSERTSRYGLGSDKHRWLIENEIWLYQIHNGTKVWTTCSISRRRDLTGSNSSCFMTSTWFLKRVPRSHVLRKFQLITTILSSLTNSSSSGSHFCSHTLFPIKTCYSPDYITGSQMASHRITFCLSWDCSQKGSKLSKQEIISWLYNSLAPLSIQSVSESAIFFHISLSLSDTFMMNVASFSCWSASTRGVLAGGSSSEKKPNWNCFQLNGITLLLDFRRNAFSHLFIRVGVHDFRCLTWFRSSSWKMLMVGAAIRCLR